jgi:drug/metabolite transporter (DMT)-like permease
MKNAGILLIVIGLTMTVFSGFNITTKKKIVDLGAVEIMEKRKTPIYWSPITGAVLAVAGVALYLSSRKKST